MQSVTSYFNRELLRGALQRTWPLWAAYTLIWLLLLPVTIFIRLSDRHIVYSRPTLSYELLSTGLPTGVMMAAVFGIFFAMAMFAYLTNSRATNGMHAMPIRREGLFLTHYLAGLFCQVVTLLVSFALAALVTAAFGVFDGYAVGMGLLLCVLLVLFFYSFGVLCMVCVGQILAGAVFYGILNFLFVGMEVLLRSFAGNFLYGYDGRSSAFSTAPLSPPVEIASSLSVSYVYDGIDPIGVRVFHLGTFAAYAAAGLVLAALALLLYRKRRSEMTGNTVAIGWLRPVFKYGVAFCSAFSLGQLLSYFVFELTDSTYTAGALIGTIACMIFAGLIGYYAAEMLLKKSFRVFKTSWKGALATSAVLILIGLSFPLDLTGYQSRVPEQSDIVSATVDLYGGNVSGSFNLSGQESIALLRDAHCAVITDKARQTEYNRRYVPFDGDTCMLRITYELADGTELFRSYDLSIDEALLSDPSSPESALTKLANCTEITRARVLGGWVPDHLEELRITGGYLNCSYYSDGKYSHNQEAELNAAQANSAFTALMQDCDAGSIESADLFAAEEDDCEYYLSLELWYFDPSDSEARASATKHTGEELYNGSFYLRVKPDMVSTLRALRGLNLIELP
ncbi:MAG: hypothetical protein PUJ93_05680 [Oscillospiraceae bacterium]|nr:hypothetical protein [Oscillospiraceae bacterium]MDY5736589.1 hypothetical protein [Oscillospiraceae bacterium]